MTRDQRFICLSSLFWGFGLGLFLYIQPLYIASLGANPEQIGLTLASSGLMVILLYIPIGLWADRRGRKPVILAGWGLGTIATFAMALAPDWRWVIPAQAAYLLSNFAVPAMNGYIAAGAGGNPTRMFAIVTSTSSLGSILSPAIGGWIGEQFGLRLVYGCAAVSFGLSTLALWNLSGQPGEPIQVRAAPRQLLTNRHFVWQVIFILLVFFAIDLGQVMAPNFLEQVRGLSLSQIGRLGTVGSFGIVVLTVLFGRVPAERRRALALAQAMAMLAMLILLNTGSLAWITLAYFIHGSNRVVRPIL
ncbi:MAG: MFS transporter, partial [Anaerolineales bacterium]